MRYGCCTSEHVQPQGKIVSFRFAAALFDGAETMPPHADNTAVNCAVQGTERTLFSGPFSLFKKHSFMEILLCFYMRLYYTVYKQSAHVGYFAYGNV